MHGRQSFRGWPPEIMAGEVGSDERHVVLVPAGSSRVRPPRKWTPGSRQATAPLGRESATACRDEPTGTLRVHGGLAVGGGDDGSEDDHGKVIPSAIPQAVCVDVTP